jgi:glycosyltransferase involved in cell wall biosynthesis
MLTLLEGPTVSVIVPTLNEADSLPWVLQNLPDWVSEVVLVDGLSTDATEHVARRIRPDVVVVHQHTPGKGAALRAGFAASSGEILVMIDADGSTDPREMHRFVDKLRDGAEFVKGSRHLPSGGSADFTPLRAAGNRGFVLLTNVLFGSRFTDLCYGYCAFWREHLEVLALTADGFEIETQLVLSAIRAGLDVREVPSYELERRAGTSNLNIVRDGVRVLQTLLGERRRFRAERTGAAIALIEVDVPITHVPPDRDRRRQERRQFVGETAGYIGPERRLADRRATPKMTRALRAVAQHEADAMREPAASQL